MVRRRPHDAAVSASVAGRSICDALHSICYSLGQTARS
jgi:hypothetical protein